MGLKVADMNYNFLKNKEIYAVDVDIENESVVTVQDKEGELTRVRVPSHIAKVALFCMENS